MIFWILIRGSINAAWLPGQWTYFIFYGYLALYAILSSIESSGTSILLFFRWMEYSFYFVGLHLIKPTLSQMNRCVFVIIFLNLIVSISQYYGFIGGLHSYGYFYDASTRVSGLTGGAWELPAVMSLIGCSFLRYNKNKKAELFIILSITIIIYLSATRSGLIGWIAGLLFVYYQKGFKVYHVALIILTFFLIIGHDRLAGIDFKAIITFDADNVPLSLWYRLQTWESLYSQMEIQNYIYGIGLGVGGIYLDGMIAHIFIEMGFVGLLAFIIYYYKISRNALYLFVILAVNGIVLDVLTATKIMFAFYWSVYYINFFSKRKQSSF
ncbi:hypothetical protein OAO13_03500 [Candidatus Pseudothioglobus singularis]|nr:hypothetical protein [Candidatus Pseudothioglobus singularis]